MRLNTFILALTLAASVQVLAEEVTLGVFHKLSDHESFEKRGEIRVNVEEWLNHIQNEQASASASYSQSSKQKQQKKPLESFASYENTQLKASSLETFSDDFVLNTRAPIKPVELEPEPTERETDEEGRLESEEEFEQRVIEWKYRQEDALEDVELKTPGSYAFYQIKLKDEKSGWEAMSSVKSCLLIASDFKEKITLHLDQDRQLFAFDYYTSASKCEDDHKKEYSLKSLDQFKIVKIDLATPGAGPKALYTRAQAIRVDPTGKPEVEKTFFQKYWMYIVPVVLMALFTGGEPEKTAA
ncbi:ER membrane protein complex subunit 10 [Mortierella sp. AM989]|nr:ER membrane protein complex subunit 10 [Mortierella sp. AM989]